VHEHRLRQCRDDAGQAPGGGLRAALRVEQLSGGDGGSGVVLERVDQLSRRTLL
jgi:hypothetical protein